MGKSKHKQMSKKDLKVLKSFDELLNKVKEGKVETDIQIVENVEKPVVQKQTKKKKTYYIEYNGIKVDINEITLKDHAYLRAEQRLNLTKEHALGQTRTMLKNSKCIGHHVSENGDESILFAKGRVGIHMTLDLKMVKTFIRHENVTYLPLKEKFLGLHEKELRKLERLESSKKRKLKTFELECAAEKSQLELRIHKSRSQTVQNVCRARIHAINQTLEFYKNEIASIEAEKRSVVSSMIAVV